MAVQPAIRLALVIRDTWALPSSQRHLPSLPRYSHSKPLVACLGSDLRRAASSAVRQSGWISISGQATHAGRVTGLYLPFEHRHG